MKHRVLWLVAVAMFLASAVPVQAAEQAPRIDEIAPQRSQAVGTALLAAAANLVYFPVRLAITTATAEVGGFAAWITGGDRTAAQAVWDSTEGQAFLTPAILQGRETLHFGRPAPHR